MSFRCWNTSATCRDTSATCRDTSATCRDTSSYVSGHVLLRVGTRPATCRDTSAYVSGHVCHVSGYVRHVSGHVCHMSGYVLHVSGYVLLRVVTHPTTCRDTSSYVSGYVLLRVGTRPSRVGIRPLHYCYYLPNVSFSLSNSPFLCGSYRLAHEKTTESSKLKHPLLAFANRGCFFILINYQNRILRL